MSGRNARLFAAALIVCSFLLDINDWNPRLDLRLECCSRFCLLTVAAFTLRATRGDRCARLLLWGLIGMSLDLFWQDTYESGRLQWAAMLVKYVAVSGGLFALLRLTAVFGDGEPPLRMWIARAAPWLGIALAVVGIVHGSLYITQCQNDCDPDLHPLDALALSSYNAYLFLGAFVRALMIAAAAAGVMTSSASERPRLLLVAIACLLFATGTLVNFSVRLLPIEALLASSTRDVIDSALQLAFPFVLWFAILKQRLFDVEYVLTRALVLGSVLTIVVIVITGVEQVVHFELGRWLDTHLIGKRFGHAEKEQKEHLEMIVEIVVGLALALLVRPLEEFVSGHVEHAFAPDREKRLEVLREFAERIPFIAEGPDLERRMLRSLERGTDATFVEAYVRDPAGGYVSTLAEGATLELDPEAARLLIRGKPLKHKAARSVSDRAELALPMLVAGKLFGVLICGPKRSEVSYAPDELNELATIAREAGASLFAFRVAA